MLRHGFACLLLIVGVGSARAETAGSNQPAQTPVEVSSPQQQQAAEAPQTAQPDKRGTDEAPLIVKILPAPDAQEQAAQQATDRNEKAAGDDEVYRFDTSLIVIGAIQIAVFALQLLAFSMQARRLHQTVSTMRGTEERSLRAYVGVEDFELELKNGNNLDYVPFDRTNPGKVFEDFVNVTVKNFGSTPAYSVTVFAHIASTENIRLPEKYFIEHDVDLFNSSDIRPFLARVLLNKEQRYVSKTHIPDVRGIVAAINPDANQMVYVFGAIYYRDAYGRPWRTKFCSVWEPWHPSGERFVPYEHYNGEDQMELLLPESDDDPDATFIEVPASEMQYPPAQEAQQ